MCLGFKNGEENITFKNLNLKVSKGYIKRIPELDKKIDDFKMFYFYYIPEKNIDKKEYEFEYTYNRIFTNKEEIYTIRLSMVFKTKKAKYTIKVPNGYKIFSYNGVIKGKENKKKIKNKDFEKTPDNREIMLILKKPKLLREYIINCKWGKDGTT